MRAGRSTVRRLLLGRNGDRLIAGASRVVLVRSAVFTPDSSPLPLDLGVAVVTSVPLIWRRVAPLPVLVLAMCGPAAQGLLLGSHTANIGQFVVLLVQLFSFGLFASGRHGPPGILVSIAAILCVQLTDPLSTVSEDVFSPPVLVLLPFLAGRLLRRQIEASRRLKRLTEQLDRQREAEAHAATLAERARIAREVHDVIAHSVGVMVVQAGAAEALAELDAAGARQALAAVRSTGRDALGELRRLLGLMVVDADQTALTPQPGLDELEVLLQQARSGGQAVSASLVGDRVPL